MIEVQVPFALREFLEEQIVPQCELNTWRSGITRKEAINCPPEVREFINALTAKLPDFGQVGKEHGAFFGYELQLCGMHEFQGEKIDKWTLYDLPYPKMIAVDHHASMHRIFRRRGKQGLIDYVKARVKGTELERLLEILNVHVFKQEREEFKKVMSDIETSKKIESEFSQ